ncbi:class I SAM-dependent methyltransferase [Pedobacter duraquae]|uniref:Methyltransferase family protein n=1 Tax=Pedobacter duraquae TaxID=425511 RepID=A0A4R6IF90_9SPHI|nr:class I SAM-dependent methyltransferase [Pedobacter duraquae]TDO20674.1 methyltransferase family protein [Pedobacter duraquae]
MEKSWDENYKDKWNIRYKNPEFAYGKIPNLFFKEWLEKLEPGKILMPAEGEGRNAVFAAQLNWDVAAFDISKEGRIKALNLAVENNVSIKYELRSLEMLNFTDESFDAIGLIYAHFAADRRSTFHQKLISYLKPGGTVILEAFSKNQLQINSINTEAAGPKELAMLFSIDELKVDFKDFEILLLEERHIILNEGQYHNGDASVVRFVGKKRSV